jgi:small subunit ribosomal protein S3
MDRKKQFVHSGLERAQLDEYLSEELERAGYAGMNLDETAQGMRIVIRAEKPGMVIGSGGKNIRKLTKEITSRFEFDDVSIDVQEVGTPKLEADIVANKLAQSLERGWYYRRAGQTISDEVMDEGAQGVLIKFSGKLMGARSSVEKFERGYIKHNGNPSKEIVETGKSTAVMPLGSIGVEVNIIKPGVELPDTFNVKSNVDLEDKIDNDSILDISEPDDESDDEPDDESGDVADEEPIDEEAIEEEIESGLRDNEELVEP